MIIINLIFNSFVLVPLPGFYFRHSLRRLYIARVILRFVVVVIIIIMITLIVLFLSVFFLALMVSYPSGLHL